MRSLSKPTIRDSRIPCKNCNSSTLYWNPEEKLYVCPECGIQEDALSTWIKAGKHRISKKEKKKKKDRQWALDVLGIKDQLKKPKKSKKEQEWAEIIERVKTHKSNGK